MRNFSKRSWNSFLGLGMCMGALYFSGCGFLGIAAMDSGDDGPTETSEATAGIISESNTNTSSQSTRMVQPLLHAGRSLYEDVRTAGDIDLKMLRASYQAWKDAPSRNELKLQHDLQGCPTEDSLIEGDLTTSDENEHLKWCRIHHRMRDMGHYN